MTDLSNAAIFIGSIAMAAGGLGIVAALLFSAAWIVGALTWRVQKHLMGITRATTAVYWVKRMEREGLTMPMHDYRRMVAEQNPKTVADYQEVDRKWSASK
jgi:hypothetical protein